MEIPERLRAAIDAHPIAHVVTLNPSGTPQISLAWIGLDGDEIVIGTMYDQTKLQNLRRDPRIAISFETGSMNSWGLNAYYVLHGQARLTDGGAPELLKGLARGYLGPEVDYPGIPRPARWLGDPHDGRTDHRQRALTPAEDEILLAAYDGSVRPDRLARLTLMRIVSDFREAMWGVLQQGVSTLDVDFVAYAAGNFDRLLRNASTPRFEDALREVAIR